MVGILNYEEQRLRQQEIEVKALVAICEWGNHHQHYRAVKRLEEIAYPNELATKINKELSEYE